MFISENATEFYKKVTKYLESAICFSCESSNLSALQAYDHDGGFKIPGIAQKQWLYVICLECKYESALWKIMQRNKMQQINNNHVNSKPMDPFPSRENPDPLGTLTLKKRNKKIETEDISNPTIDEFLDGKSEVEDLEKHDQFAICGENKTRSECECQECNTN